MKLENERVSDDVIFDAEFEDEEFSVLWKYGQDKCPVDEVNAFYVNWAMVDILKRQLGNMVDVEEDDQLNLFTQEN